MTLYERPILIVDPGTHTSISRAAAADAAGRFLATGSDDKTVRIWSASDGNLLRTIRMPTGPGYIGAIYAVAMNPDGSIVAAGGWGQSPEGPPYPIFLFDRSMGKMTKRIGGLPNVVTELVFSTDGRYLAAVCYSGGLRVFDRDKHWSEAFRDAAYSGQAMAQPSPMTYGWLHRPTAEKFDSMTVASSWSPLRDALSGRVPQRLAFPLGRQGAGNRNWR